MPSNRDPSDLHPSFSRTGIHSQADSQPTVICPFHSSPSAPIPDTPIPQYPNTPIPNTQYPIPRYPIPDTRYPIPDTRYPIPDTRYPIPDTRYPIPVETITPSYSCCGTTPASCPPPSSLIYSSSPNLKSCRRLRASPARLGWQDDSTKPVDFPLTFLLTPWGYSTYR